MQIAQRMLVSCAFKRPPSGANCFSIKTKASVKRRHPNHRFTVTSGELRLKLISLSFFFVGRTRSFMRFISNTFFLPFTTMTCDALYTAAVNSPWSLYWVITQSKERRHVFVTSICFVGVFVLCVTPMEATSGRVFILFSSLGRMKELKAFPPSWPKQAAFFFLFLCSAQSLCKPGQMFVGFFVGCVLHCVPLRFSNNPQSLVGFCSNLTQQQVYVGVFTWK